MLEVFDPCTFGPLGLVFGLVTLAAGMGGTLKIGRGSFYVGGSTGGILLLIGIAGITACG